MDSKLNKDYVLLWILIAYLEINLENVLYVSLGSNLLMIDVTKLLLPICWLDSNKMRTRQITKF
jgi:hypothetical protein